MSHFIKKCGSCGIVLEQCRCPSSDKEIYWGTCIACAEKALKQGSCEIVDCDSVDTKFMPKEPSRLTLDEQKVLDMSAELWNAICALSEVHPMEKQEICTAIHDIQMRILARPELRVIGWPEGVRAWMIGQLRL